jgi:hypothetical protein
VSRRSAGTRVTLFLAAVACLGAMTAAPAAATARVPVDFEKIQEVPLLNGSGVLRMWRTVANGNLHAEVVGAPQGTVAVERRDDNAILVFAVNGQNGGSASTSEVKDPAPLRGVYNSNGLTTVTNWVTTV